MSKDPSSQKEILCLACGEELRNFSFLVCPECLNLECSEYVKMAEEVDEEELDKLEENSK